MHISRKSLKDTISLVVIASTLLTPFKTYAAGYVISEDVVSEDAYIEYEFTFDIGAVQFPSQDNGRIVWKDDRNGNADIYMYDLNTGTETRITSDSNIQRWPSISGDIIVWQDDRNTHWDIYMYDLGTDTETRVTTDENDQTQPCVYGDTIVWHDDRNYLVTANDIYMYDIATTTESVLVDELGDQYSPYIDNDVVVWEDNRGASSDIYYYDFNDPVEGGVLVSTSATDQYWPTTDGTTVVWTEDRNLDTGFDIYAYDLSEDELITVTTNNDVQGFGHVDGSLIVFSDYRDGNWNVYLYDLAHEFEFPLVTNIYDQGMARIQGNRVVWMDSRNEPVSVVPAEIRGVIEDGGTGQPFTGIAVYDGVGPTFGALPGTSDPINTGDGTIDTNPFNIQVRPVDEVSSVDHVDFYADETLLCTDRTPDANGVYECSWDPSETCGAEQIRVIATDTLGNLSLVLTRDIEIGSAVCPTLSNTGSRVLPLAVSVGSMLVAVAVLPNTLVKVVKRVQSTAR